MSGPLTLSELQAGSRLQGRIIGALMMRELRTRFGEYRLGYAWALLEPLVQIGIMSGMFYMLGSRPPVGTSYAMFFFTGFVTFALFRDLATRTASSISANRALLSFPPVRNMDTVWARLALEVMTHVASMIFVLAIFAYAGVQVIPDSPAFFAAGLLSMLVLGAGVGIFNAAVSPIVKPWMIVFSWVMRIQYFVSGIFFLPERTPPAALAYLAWNPAAHSIAWVREGFYGGYKSNMLIMYYPIVFGLVMALVGLVVEKVYRRQVEAK